MTDPRRCLDGSTILLIDGNPSSRQLVGGILRDHGCRTLHLGEHARDALDLLDVTAGRLDLLICGVALRRVGGLAVVQALRLGRTRGRPGTPAVLFHPNANAELARRGDGLDVGLTFGLPIAAQDLCRRLVEVMAHPVAARLRAERYAGVPLDWAPSVPAQPALARAPTAREAAMADLQRLAAELHAPVAVRP